MEGKVHLLVENEASLLAGLLFMKRGCDAAPVAFEDENIFLLQKFSPTKLKLNPIRNLDEIKGNILVSGQNYVHFKEYDMDSIVMRPLIAFSDERIKEELDKYS